MKRVEYEWVKQNRGVLLEFCRAIKPSDFTREIDGFAFQSIRNALVHIADCYNAWLGSFILLKTNKPITPKEVVLELGLDEIIGRFQDIDSLVNEIFEKLADQLDEPVNREIPWRQEGDALSITPGKLLMHTITHEYHHKGQIVVLARQMGYEPPNTDVLGTED